MADASGGAAAPLLDLDTLIIRPAIMIDGRRYEMLSSNEMTIVASHRLGVKGRRIEQLAASEAADDGVELDRLISEVAREVLVDVPDDVFGKLTGAHKMSVVDVFTGLLLRNKLGVAGAMATAMGVPQIGERLSLASSGSSAATPAGGWSARLRRWFGRT